MSEGLLKENIRENGLTEETKHYLPIHDEQKGVYWNIYISNCIATLGLIAIGMCMGWMSPVLPQLMTNNTEINPLGTPISTLQITVISSASYISSFCGFFVTAKLSDMFGRKKMLLVGSVCLSLDMITIAFSSNINIYYICLVLNGISYNFVYVNAPIYNAEISAVKNRGKLGCLTGLGIPSGMLLTYIFAPITSVKSISLLCATPSALHVLLNFFLVESPNYLALKGKDEKAMKALKHFRNTENFEMIQYEFKKIKQSVIENSRVSKTRFIELFKLKSSRKACYIAMILCFSQQMSGVNAILSFMATIFNEADAYLSGNMVAILVGIIQIPSFITAAYFVDKLGRRILLLISSFSVLICLFALGVYFYLKHIQIAIPSSIKWLPIIFVIIYIIGYSLGLGPIPINMIGEVFPTELRSVGVSAALIIESFIANISMFCFPLLKNMYGVHVCFFLQSLMTLLGFIAIFCLVPELKKKSFFEIQQLLSR